VFGDSLVRVLCFDDFLLCLKLVPPPLLYFLLFVSVAGEVGVMSLLSLEVGGKPLSLEVVVTSLSLEVEVGLPDQSLFKSLPPWRRRISDKVSSIFVSIRIMLKLDKVEEELNDHLLMHARRSQVEQRENSEQGI
jgi:hypothetical protein